MREALIVACDYYQDPGLRRLRSPVHDALGLVRVLGDSAIGDYRVRPLINRPSAVIREEIEDFFADRWRDDLLLAYFSCHGIKDEQGRLYFAASDTKLRRLAATGISSVFVNERVERSRSRRKVLLLDCCYSGAFAQGLAPRSGGEEMHIAERFEGSGLAVITASDALEYAWETTGLRTLETPRPSIFSAAVIDGLATGDADRDEDGEISIGDLYDYVFDRVRRDMPGQTPTRSELGRGELIVARNVRAPAYGPLPVELRQAIQNPFPGVRVGAISELDQLLDAAEPAMSRAAGQALDRLRRDDQDSRVRDAAARALRNRTVTDFHAGNPGTAVSQPPSGTPVITPEQRTDRGEADLQIDLRPGDGTNLELVLQLMTPAVRSRTSGPFPVRVDFERLSELRDDAAAYGAALADMLFLFGPADPVSREIDAATGLDLRVRLRIAAPTEYHAVQWELLRLPGSTEPLAQTPGVAFSRYLDDPGWRELPALAPHELRALAVVAGPWDIGGHRTGGRLLTPVDVATEIGFARDCMHGFQAARELTAEAATVAGLVEALRADVDMLYLVCHGSAMDGDPLLYLANSDGTTDVVSGSAIADGLSRLTKPPTLIIINACPARPGAGESGLRDDGRLLPIAIPFLAAGVAAVVVLQAAIPRAAVEDFCRAFLAAFAGHGLIDRAMADGQAAIREHGPHVLPVLYSRTRSGRTTYRKGFREGHERRWKSLELALRHGRLTAVIGRGLVEPIVGSSRDIATRWAARLPYVIPPRERSDLARLAEYVRVRETGSEAVLGFQRQLAEEIAARRRDATPDNPIWQLPPAGAEKLGLDTDIRQIGRRLRGQDPLEPHAVLAALPIPVYVTTSWTELLQDALRDRGKQPVTAGFAWNNYTASSQRRSDPTVNEPLVYHLFGRLSDPPSMVLTERDHHTWLSEWGGARRMIPAAVKGALAASSLLFLGSRWDDLDFPIVLRTIEAIPGRFLRDNANVAVLPFPGTHERQEQADMELAESSIATYWGTIAEFISEWREHMGVSDY